MNTKKTTGLPWDNGLGAVEAELSHRYIDSTGGYIAITPNDAIELAITIHNLRRDLDAARCKLDRK